MQKQIKHGMRGGEIWDELKKRQLEDGYIFVVKYNGENFNRYLMPLCGKYIIYRNPASEDPKNYTDVLPSKHLWEDINNQVCANENKILSGTRITPINSNLNAYYVYDNLKEFNDRNFTFPGEFFAPEGPSKGGLFRKSLYKKIGEKHKCVDGKCRMLWEKGNNMYVRVKSKITGKLVYKKVKRSGKNVK